VLMRNRCLANANLAPRTHHPNGRRILLPLQRTAAYPFTNTCEVVGCGVGLASA
jgi:hypothetical protein